MFADIAKDAYLWALRAMARLLAPRVATEPGRVLLVLAFPGRYDRLREQLLLSGLTIDEFEPGAVASVSQLMKMLRAQFILVDNYYAPLVAVTAAHRTIVQLWHADGAVKKFGLAAHVTYSARALRRYRRVYEAFDHVLVGSEKMAEVFRRSFDLPDSKILRFGYVGADDYLAPDFSSRTNEVRAKYRLSGTTTVLYLPTFRTDDSASQPQLEFITRASGELGPGVRLLYHLHPQTAGRLAGDGAVTGSATAIRSDEVPALLASADLLVTDYSGVVFERAMFRLPVAFFAYDYSEYSRTNGLVLDREELPGPVFSEIGSLLEFISAGAFGDERIASFGREWNEYNDGRASERLVEHLVALKAHSRRAS